MINSSLIQGLLKRGDQVALAKGKVVITPISGRQVPNNWLDDHRNGLIDCIINRLSLNAYIYEGFTTGKYGEHCNAGVCLQFIELLTGKGVYAIFNVELHRQRNTASGKKGSPLPGKQFRVRKNHEFCKFWVRSGLSLPKRLSAFHDYMGNLKGVVFTGKLTKADRLDCQSITTLNVTDQQLRETFEVIDSADKLQTVSLQHPDKSPTIYPDNELAETQTQQNFRSIYATCLSNYGLRNQGGAEARGVVIPIDCIKKPEEQTAEEWLADYAK